VDSAALAAFAPLRLAEGASRAVTIEGYTAGPDEDMRLAYNVVSPAYFRTMRIELLAGREFAGGDVVGGQQVVIVNETMARRFWTSARDALGQRIRIANDDRDDWRVVAGVARDIKYLTLNERPRPYLYLPLAQAHRTAMMLHVRAPVPTESLLSQVRAEVNALDPNLPILDAQTLAAQARVGTFLYEAVASALALFGLLAIGLAAVGIYGLASYTVRQRTHEIGIYMALGARQRDLVWRFLRAGLWLGAVGASIGTLVALALTRLMASLLFGVSPTDPLAFGVALGLVLGTAALASFIPAWRAARVPPASILQHHH
jgi:predicted permease